MKLQRAINSEGHAEVELFIDKDGERIALKSTSVDLPAFIAAFSVEILSGLNLVHISRGEVATGDPNAQIYIQGEQAVEIMEKALTAAWPIMCKLAGYKAEGVCEKRVLWVSEIEPDSTIQPLIHHTIGNR